MKLPRTRSIHQFPAAEKMQMGRFSAKARIPRRPDRRYGQRDDLAGGVIRL